MTNGARADSTVIGPQKKLNSTRRRFLTRIKIQSVSIYAVVKKIPFITAVAYVFANKFSVFWQTYTTGNLQQEDL